MYVLSLIAASFAVYRAARFVGWDQLTANLRKRLDDWADDAVPFDDDGAPGSWRDYVADLVSCPYCVSFWMAGVAYAVVLAAVPSSSEPVLEGGLAAVVFHLMIWWAVAGAACLMLRVDDSHVDVKVTEPAQ